MRRTAFTLAACLAAMLALPAAADEAERIEAALRLYEAGQGRKAIATLLPLARQGQAEAAYWLGRIHYYGKAGVPRDWRTAARWFERAARAGHAGGQYKLGGMYYAGRGVRRDLGQAIDWWAKAAAQGHPEALNNLGALVSTGTGVAADAELGLALQLIAAEKGSADAQENVRHKLESEAAKALAREFAASPERLVERIVRRSGE